MLTIVLTRTSDNGENTIKIFASECVLEVLKVVINIFHRENIAHQGQWLIKILKNELKYVYYLRERIEFYRTMT